MEESTLVKSTTRRRPRRERRAQPLAPIRYRTVRKRLSSLRTSIENDQLYRPIDATDPDFLKLAASIRTHGLREPLVVTADNFIVSGHRRYAALQLLRQVVAPCRIGLVRTRKPMQRRSEFSGHLLVQPVDRRLCRRLFQETFLTDECAHAFR